MKKNDNSKKPEYVGIPIEVEYWNGDCDEIEPILWKNMDFLGFIDKFPDEDKGWMDKKDRRVIREFNNFRTFTDRQRYDVFVDTVKRMDPMYKTPPEQLEELKGQIYAFMAASAADAPLFICSGESGVGKNTAFDEAAKELNLVKYGGYEHKWSGKEYDYVSVYWDVRRAKELCDVLSDHNGKIIVFDYYWNDKLLTTHSELVVSLFTSLTDVDPSKRFFKNKTGNMELFTGKLMFLTDKPMYRFNKHIIPLAQKAEIWFTVRETIECFMKQQRDIDNIKAKTLDERDDIYKSILEYIYYNRDKIDPGKFSFLSVRRLFSSAHRILKAKEVVEKDPQLARDLGLEELGLSKDWDKAWRGEVQKEIHELNQW